MNSSTRTRGVDVARWLPVLLLQLILCTRAMGFNTHDRPLLRADLVRTTARHVVPPHPASPVTTVGPMLPSQAHLEVLNKRSEFDSPQIESRAGFTMDKPAHLRRRLLIGSSAPECGQACGACSPCSIRIVGYECSMDTGSHAEGCPLSYTCTCHGKSFPIP